MIGRSLGGDPPVRLAVLAALLAGPTALAAQDLDFDGLWRSNPNADCGQVSATGSALRIEDEVLYGAENECRMTRPVEVRDMEAVLYDMECEADGTAFTERAMFLKAADGGLYLIWNGFAFKYEACGEDPALGTVTTSEEIGIAE